MDLQQNTSSTVMPATRAMMMSFLGTDHFEVRKKARTRSLSEVSKRRTVSVLETLDDLFTPIRSLPRV
jgi:hypothetical protein